MYIADLHIHSRYSRATSKDCTPEHLDLWARRKGIHLIGTGDFTHRAWRDELREKLEPAKGGLYRLKKEYRIKDGTAGTAWEPRFVVTGEISSIYKKYDKTRKVHSLILLPGLEDADLISAKLETIGNIHSDGRPILGLDCHDLLEIVLDLCPRAIYVPAHIWTPHFSMFGAFTAFRSVEECFGDLSPHIHALETGLSSDPPMNWRVSALDRYQLISNSDAHSPAKLGREANLLNIGLSYEELYRAIQEGDGLEGTIEFFPEEGKYHYDGHRKCSVCLSPVEAERHQGLCPVCGRKLTTGVSHRIEQLSDRPEGYVPGGAKRYESLVPLPEVIGASIGRSAASVKVVREYEAMLEQLGPEFEILRRIPIEEIRKSAGTLIGEGIKRLREGKVIRTPGFDGEYGKIFLFQPEELNGPDGQMSFLDQLEPSDLSSNQKSDLNKICSEKIRSLEGEKREERGIGERKSGKEAKEKEPNQQEKSHKVVKEATADSENPEQQEAIRTQSRAAAVTAGPGTGKTYTLIAHIQYLIEECKVKPSEITAVTFTNRAAGQLKERLQKSFGKKQGWKKIHAGTFHALCLSWLQEKGETGILIDEVEALEILREVIREAGLKKKPEHMRHLISLYKTAGKSEGPDPDFEEKQKSGPAVLKEKKPDLLTEENKKPDYSAKENKRLNLKEEDLQIIEAYNHKLKEQGLWDYDDLLAETRRLLLQERAEAENTKEDLTKENRTEKEKPGETPVSPKKPADSKKSYKYLLVDEFQDINPIQYELLKLWNQNGSQLFVIGDPDQSIYGFRGSSAACFEALRADYPMLREITLTRNYRSTPEILAAALPVISKNPGPERILLPQNPSGAKVRLVTAADPGEEAFFLAEEIIRQLGGVDMIQAHEAAHTKEKDKNRSFGDIAILYRTHRQADRIEHHLKQEGIPCIIGGRDPFLSEPTVRGTLCFFRHLLHPADTRSKEISIRLLWNDEQNFSQTAEKYTPLLQKTKPEKLLTEWTADLGLEKDQSIKKLIELSRPTKTIEEFLNHLLLGTESDLQRHPGKHYTSDAVHLMTLHGSKGLEFPVVLLCGLQKGLLPLETGAGQTDLTEERRLFYVGMTRAGEELILLTTESPSPFLKELPEDKVTREEAHIKKQTPKETQLNLFDWLKTKN